MLHTCSEHWIKNTRKKEERKKEKKKMGGGGGEETNALENTAREHPRYGKHK